MVAKAKEELEQEILDKEEEKDRYLSERAPPLKTSGLSLAQLQVKHGRFNVSKFSLGGNTSVFYCLSFGNVQDLCRELHAKIDVVDEERYDIEAKVMLNTREVTAWTIVSVISNQCTEAALLLMQ